jgi:hypothetical protein
MLNMAMNCGASNAKSTNQASGKEKSTNALLVSNTNSVTIVGIRNMEY